MLTEPNTARAGAIVEMSFARFKASMAMFSAERTLSRPFVRCESASMVATGGNYEEMVWDVGCAKGPEP